MYDAACAAKASAESQTRTAMAGLRVSRDPKDGDYLVRLVEALANAAAANYLDRLADNIGTEINYVTGRDQFPEAKEILDKARTAFNEAMWPQQAEGENQSDEYDYPFGRCPVCGDDSPYVNIGKTHWKVCERDKIAWAFGGNLFSTWVFETEEDWQRNRELVETCKVIDAKDAVYHGDAKEVQR
ncbi:MAG: hypothetical protein IT335_16185 [Thermomicrobiales bacterium]|nr:hypothetical protein [Thermomicrobiales bacterium]